MRERVRKQWRKVALMVLDTGLLSASYVLAFVLRLGWEGLFRNLPVVGATLPVVLGVTILVHLRMGLFHGLFRYASLETATTILKSAVVSVGLTCTVLFLLFRLEDVPRAVFVVHGMTSVLFIGGSRLAFRIRRRRRERSSRRTRVLLYGVEDTTEWVLRGLDSPGVEHAAVGIIDDDPVKHGRRVRGWKIFGGLGIIQDVVRETGAKELWVCIPGLFGERLRKVYAAARDVGLRVKVLPTLQGAFLGAELERFHEPDIADLLRRPPRTLDRGRVERWIRGRRVLITGAGGSIGSELATQIAAFGPSSLALCDVCEFQLFRIHCELGREHGDMIAPPLLVDVRHPVGVRRMMRDARPDVVFHAAAYKHVPMVELNPCEGVLTNVGGLYNVATAAVDAGVEDFVFISTDKAVRPTNVMGASKRIGETIVQFLARTSSTRFSGVRFGNVLGSSGSVVPIFQEQIRRGGPVTVTHREMTRFFMLVSEAVELVTQAGSIAGGGEVFVLDMGEPVRISDMARDLIGLMGKTEDEVRVEFTGVRPGERIHEELLIDPSDSKTEFEDIWIDGEGPPRGEWSEFRESIEDLLRRAGDGDDEASKAAVEELSGWPRRQRGGGEVIETASRSGMLAARPATEEAVVSEDS